MKQTHFLESETHFWIEEVTVPFKTATQKKLIICLCNIRSLFNHTVRVYLYVCVYLDVLNFTICQQV